MYSLPSLFSDVYMEDVKWNHLLNAWMLFGNGGNSRRDLRPEALSVHCVIGKW